MSSSVHRGDALSPGATVVEGGVNFAVHAPYADTVEVCLFEEDVERRLILPGTTGTVHHGLVSGIDRGQEYGFRVTGLWEPASGVFSNPAKVLLDPHARSITGELVANPALVTHRPRSEDRPDERDNSRFVPRSVVTDSQFDWKGDRPPRVPMAETVLYETHVRGLTMRHPSVAPELRGTYSGLVTEPVLDHLKALGVTTIELLPVHTSVTEPWMQRRGLTNYWGYSTAGFFSPHESYAATDDPVDEFKQMVMALHREGLEVILDVVYNHTGEGNHLGATLCFRGLDNPGFYALDPRDRRRYLDWTGTGNSVDVNSPWALSLITDSLRYWVEEMHVDGFRFDLATALGRAAGAFDPGAPFFRSIEEDEVLREVKLIAEPWDLGPDSYQLGNFPAAWSEWNGRYRDDFRDFWRGTQGLAGKVSKRFEGSPDVFPARGPLSSINFITSHDGFTLVDLVSYDHKHNQANREHNHDGESHNRSWNSGVEGPTDQPEVQALRRRRAKSLLATVLLSQGVPMILGGDEIGRTQNGNNNAYCQDNEVSWYDWESIDWDMVSFVQRAAALRRIHPILRRSGFPSSPGAWFNPAGEVVPEWTEGSGRSLGALIEGPDGNGVLDALYVMLNPDGHRVPFVLPSGTWELVLSTGQTIVDGGTASLEDFSLALVRRV